MGQGGRGVRKEREGEKEKGKERKGVAIEWMN